MSDHHERVDLAADPRLKLVDRAMKRLQYQPDALIEVLHTAQEAFGFLSRELLAHIAASLKLPESQVFGVATFYHFFSLRPKGDHTCIVCTGTACYVKGAGEIVTSLERAYGVRAGQTTADGKLSLGTARCLGNCSLAPMMTLDDRVHGPETPQGASERIRRVLEAGDEQS
ncbi:bidirectional hydrogenase complex protein HoxE [Trichlorobacter ammonificans]|uniref:[NiFe] hydrogenase, Hox E subunit n=1 Tax=Trichlorobacter ammonificans TaxID=2916410 RepID=A0ABM9DAW9_9BACT|nr:bidirectional hydrogenase complex protein HoxE [Trichlorobacter ammonificans]CAH2031905.1 [NiFe] hydrogenase, Hox E subunit [Trichlorobacter ammonificans]